MITRAELARAIHGAWRLARLDRGGLRYFDNTPEAFWRSFYAALVVAPPFGALTWMRLAGEAPAGGWLRIALLELIVYVIGWVAFPLAMHEATRRMGRADRYLRYIAAYNWATVIEVGVYAALALTAESALLPPTTISVLALATTFAILGYRWFITRVGLEVTRAVAVGVVLLGVAITILANLVKLWLI